MLNENQKLDINISFATLFKIVAVVGLVFLAVVLCNVLHLPECNPTGWSQLGVMYIHPISRMLEFVIGMVAAQILNTFASRVKLDVLPATALELSSIVAIGWLSLNTPYIRAISIPWITNAGSLWLMHSGIPMIPCAVLILTLALQRGLISKLLSTRIFVLLAWIDT